MPGKSNGFGRVWTRELSNRCTSYSQHNTFPGGWVNSRAGLNGFGKHRHPTGFVPRTVQPVASRYTDWAISALHLSIQQNKTKWGNAKRSSSYWTRVAVTGRNFSFCLSLSLSYTHTHTHQKTFTKVRGIMTVFNVSNSWWEQIIRVYITSLPKIIDYLHMTAKFPQ
jgi:hypothetical protein